MGYERHFKATKHFDFYAGAEAGYGLMSYSGNEKSESVTTNYSANGVVQSTTYNNREKEYVNSNTSGTTSNHYFTGSVFTGVDFYVYKNLYLGTELGINFKSAKSPNTYYNETQENWTTNASGAETYRYTSSYSGETGVTTTTTVYDNRPETSTRVDHVTTNETRNTTLKLFIEPSIRLGWRF